MEENAAALRVLRQNLQTLGLADRVRVLALPVAGALKKLSAQGAQFNLAILDMQMPEMEGLMLADELRKIDSTKELPLVMLTSLGPRLSSIPITGD